MEDLSPWKEKFEECIYAKKLLDKLEYLNTKVINPVDIEEIKKGIYYARKYHGLQMRKSGDPYYSHPIEVAIMVVDYFYDKEVIIASLLHDTVEDTKMSLNQIKFIFGEVVAKLVDKVTKVTLNYQLSKEETLYKLFYELSNYDKKAVTIKLFDRLHNMYTLEYIKSIEKQKRIALETLQVYIPLAKYLNIASVEQELNNLTLKALNL